MTKDEKSLAGRYGMTRGAVRGIRRRAGLAPAHPEKRNKRVEKKAPSSQEG